MKREAIEQQAKSYTLAVFDELDDFSDVTQAYIDGAEWMQKTMIEEACEYLRRHMYSTPIFEHDEDDNPVNYVCASCCDSVEEFINNFSKAMEE